MHLVWLLLLTNYSGGCWSTFAGSLLSNASHCRRYTLVYCGTRSRNLLCCAATHCSSATPCNLAAAAVVDSTHVLLVIVLITGVASKNFCSLTAYLLLATRSSRPQHSGARPLLVLYCGPRPSCYLAFTVWCHQECTVLVVHSLLLPRASSLTPLSS